jgi:hypothetical protein
LRRAGDRSLELAFLLLRAWACLGQGEIADEKKMIDEKSGLLAGKCVPHLGHDAGHVGRLAWKERRADDVERLAKEAPGGWRLNLVRYPVFWVCLWPQIGARLAGGRHAESLEVKRDLFDAAQMCQPVALEALVTAAISARNVHRHSLAANRLGEALDLTGELNFV